MAIFKKLIGVAPTRNHCAVPAPSAAPQFSTKDAVDHSTTTAADLSHLCSTPQKQLRRQMMRLVVFSEQDNRLLYDSDTVIAVADRIIPDARPSACGRFQFLPHNKDTSQIAKMVFGTLPTSMKNGSFKIHTLGHIGQLMVSRVFAVPKHAKFSTSICDPYKCMASSMSSDSDTQSYYSTIRSLDGIRGSAKKSSASSTDPPEAFTRVRNSSLQLETEDSVMDDLRAFSPNRLSRARRRELSLKGLCNDTGSLKWGSRSRMSSCSSVNDAEDMRQYGFALIFTIDEKEFVFQHDLQLEKEIFKLETQIHKAALSKTQFFQLIHQGWVEFCDCICLLHNTMRIQAPVWLSLMDPNLQNDTAARFCSTLARLVETLDNKQTKYFLSTLLTSVLMNHLAWVASVAPPDSCSYNRSLLLGTSVIDSIRHPYNALLAQFMEICGCVGLGNRLAKTVIIGDQPELIAEILYVLSYFVRCSSVEERRPDILSSVSAAHSTPILSDAQSSDVLDECAHCSSSSSKGQMASTSTSATQHNGNNGHHANHPPNNKCPCSFPGMSSNKSSPSKLSKSSSSATSSRLPTMDGMDSNECSYDSALMPPPPLPQPFPSPPHGVNHLHSNGSQEDDSANFAEPRPCKMRALDISSPQTPRRLDLILDVNHVFVQTDLRTIAKTSPRRSDHSSSLGRSLLAGVINAYSSHFVLSGIDKRSADMSDVYLSMYEDVKHPAGEPCSNSMLSPSSSTSSNFDRTDIAGLPPAPLSSTQFSPPPIHRRMHNAPSPMGSPKSNSQQSEKSVRDITQTVIVAADCTNWIVRAISSENCQVDDSPVTTPSDAIVSMLEQFLQLYKLKCAPTFLISFMEDRLGAILAKSHTLVNLVTSEEELPTPPDVDMDTTDVANREDHCDFGKTRQSSFDENDGNKQCPPSANVMSMQRVASVLGCDCSDLRLILNVAAVYSPPVLSAAL